MIGMSIIKVGNISSNKDGTPNLTQLADITENELSIVYDAIEKMSGYVHLKRVWHMVIENGVILNKFLDNVSSGTSPIAEKDCINIINKGNYHIFNFCCTIGIYIDMINKRTSIEEPDKLANLTSVFHNFYDDYFEYRFWVKFRDYIVHYDLPFTKYSRDLSGSKITCSKDHLLKFSSWKHVRKDIESMKDDIDIQPYIAKIQTLIAALFNVYTTSIANRIVNAFDVCGDFMKKYNLETPAVLRAKSITDFENGIMTVSPINMADVNEAIKLVMKSHNITINCTNK